MNSRAQHTASIRFRIDAGRKPSSCKYVLYSSGACFSMVAKRMRMLNAGCLSHISTYNSHTKYKIMHIQVRQWNISRKSNLHFFAGVFPPSNELSQLSYRSRHTGQLFDPSKPFIKPVPLERSYGGFIRWECKIASSPRRLHLLLWTTGRKTHGLEFLPLRCGIRS
jgi:hypothetical protein